MSASTQSSPNYGRPDLDFLTLFYGTLFKPIETFKNVAALTQDPRYDQTISWLLVGAAALVAAVSITSPLADVMAQSSKLGAMGNPLFQMPIAAIIGLVNWAALAGVFALMAYGFTGHARYRIFLVLSGFALLPFLLQAPIALLFQGHISGEGLGFNLALAGSIIGLVAMFIVWLWSGILFMLALGTAYNMSFERTLIAILTPNLLLVLGATGLIAFFMQLARLVS
ncbi:MAG: YIP1 family protein [Vampirovibrionales bacterium]|nr:YIP1 family protein [Vampirovibrionales bacterium]